MWEEIFLKIQVIQERKDFFARPVCVQNRPGKTGATLSNTKTWSLRGHFSGAGN
jgi:hypothetical protein